MELRSPEGHLQPVQSQDLPAQPPARLPGQARPPADAARGASAPGGGGGVGGRAAALEAERVPGGLGAARRRPGGERAVGFPSGRAPGRLSQAALFLVDNKGRSKGLAVQVRSPRGSLRSPVIKASAPRVSGRPSPRLPGRRAARPAGDQRSPGLHPKEAGPLPPPPHLHPPPAKPTGENRSRHPPGPRPSHPELPGGAGTRGPERVATCRGRANWLQRAGAGRRARGPPEVGPRLPRATSGLRGRGGAGGRGTGPGAACRRGRGGAGARGRGGAVCEFRAAGPRLKCDFALAGFSQAVPDLELPAQHRNAERLFITLRPPQPPNTAPPPRVALDSLKRSPASAARWRHLELGVGKAAPSARLVALAAPGDAAAQRGGQRKTRSRVNTPFGGAAGSPHPRVGAPGAVGGRADPGVGTAPRAPGARTRDPSAPGRRGPSAGTPRDPPQPRWISRATRPSHVPRRPPRGGPSILLPPGDGPSIPLPRGRPAGSRPRPRWVLGGCRAGPGLEAHAGPPRRRPRAPRTPRPSPSWRVRIAYGRKRTPRGPTFPPWKPKSKNRITAGGVDQFSLQAVHRPPPAVPFPSSSPGHYPTPHLQTSRGGFFPSFLAPPSAPRTPPPAPLLYFDLKSYTSRCRAQGAQSAGPRQPESAEALGRRAPPLCSRGKRCASGNSQPPLRRGARLGRKERAGTGRLPPAVFCGRARAGLAASTWARGESSRSAPQRPLHLRSGAAGAGASLSQPRRASAPSGLRGSSAGGRGAAGRGAGAPLPGGGGGHRRGPLPVTLGAASRRILQGGGKMRPPIPGLHLGLRCDHKAARRASRREAPPPAGWRGPWGGPGRPRRGPSPSPPAPGAPSGRRVSSGRARGLRASAPSGRPLAGGAPGWRVLGAPGLPHVAVAVTVASRGKPRGA
ncbi:collagen alpha-2(I) chain-like isoform X2 [Canis lupus familiaris]|uniref:collagen alpha-2(I) chain-like isoform X2 n=1 Tax=Canis lupus familiaris TaxID=9615 RepID=UPI0018F337CA|nr:collagen alpha-2(I) chain-like isoform X2 [Canis lupus familiaris]